MLLEKTPTTASHPTSVNYPTSPDVRVSLTSNRRCTMFEVRDTRTSPSITSTKDVFVMACTTSTTANRTPSPWQEFSPATVKYLLTEKNGLCIFVFMCI